MMTRQQESAYRLHSLLELLGVTILMAIIVQSHVHGWLDPFARLLGFSS